MKLFFVDKNMNEYYSILERLINKNYNIKLYINIESEEHEDSEETLLLKLRDYGFVEKEVLNSCTYNRVNYEDKLDKIKLNECYKNIEYIKLIISKKMIENINQSWLKNIVASTDFYGENYNEFDDDYRIELMVKSSELSLEQFSEIYYFSFAKTNNIFLAGFKDDMIFFKVAHNIYDMYYLEKKDFKDLIISEGYLFLELNRFNSSICEFIKKSRHLKIDYVLSIHEKKSLVCHNSHEVTIDESLYELFRYVENFTEFEII